MSYKKSLNNGNRYRLYLNNISELTQYQMTNLTDGFYDLALKNSFDGIFKAVCLSGITTEDNDMGSSGSMDASLTPRGS